MKPRKGGLLGFASGVAALVAMKTQSEDFPIFMIWMKVLAPFINKSATSLQNMHL